MANKGIISTGTGLTPRPFQQLFCAAEKMVTPHSAGRSLGWQEEGYQIEVRCRRCGSQGLYTMQQLPDDFKVYQIRVTGEDGPHMPDFLRPLTFLEESFEVVALSLQDAHDRAQFVCSLPLAGHLTRYYINGELHLNERF